MGTCSGTATFRLGAVQEPALGKALGGKGYESYCLLCGQSCWNFVTVSSFATEDGQYEIPYGVLVLSYKTTG
jgi:hypothetical protein